MEALRDYPIIRIFPNIAERFAIIAICFVFIGFLLFLIIGLSLFLRSERRTVEEVNRQVNGLRDYFRAQIVDALVCEKYQSAASAIVRCCDTSGLLYYWGMVRRNAVVLAFNNAFLLQELLPMVLPYLDFRVQKELIQLTQKLVAIEQLLEMYPEQLSMLYKWFQATRLSILFVQPCFVWWSTSFLPRKWPVALRQQYSTLTAESELQKQIILELLEGNDRDGCWWRRWWSARR